MGSGLNFDDKLLGYVENHTPAEPELYQKLRQETHDLGAIREMQISWIQGRFMQLVASLIGARRYLEIGVFTGYSTLAVAEAMGPEGKITALDIDEDWTSIGKRYWQEAGVDERIDLQIGDAIESLDGLVAGGATSTYDMAFIDADKRNIPNYFDYCLKLLRQGGLVIVDNVLWSGDVINPDDDRENTKAIRAFNDQIIGDDRVLYSMVPVGDGLILAQKK